MIFGTNPMSIHSEILALSQTRSKEAGYSYEGILYPTEAWSFLSSQLGYRLVDVRTRAERDWVGRIPGALEVEWAFYPGMQINPDFISQLQLLVEKSTPIMFLCRSGARSHSAATLATRAGFLHCFNILEGFEGDKDALEHRNSINGWRNAGLPWVQG